MNYRLIQKKLQESPATTDVNFLPGVAAVLLYACSANLHFAIPAQLLTLFGGTVVVAMLYYYLVLESRALTERCIDTMMESNNATTDWDATYRQTSQTSLVNNQSHNPGYASVSTERRDVLIFEQSPLVQVTCLIAGIIMTALLTMIAIGDQYLRLAGTYELTAEARTTTLIVGIALLGLVINQLRKPLRRVVFDRSARVFWIEQVMLFTIKVKESAQMPVQQIVALQRIIHTPNTTLINTILSGTTQLSSKQELNVIFSNGERVNVVFHNDCYTLKKDATLLSNFLQVPVWVARQPD